MNGSLRKLLLITRFSLLRLIRQPAATILMVGLPLVLIPLMGAVFSKIGNWDAYLGAPDVATFVAVGLVIMFQLMGGRFSMEGTRDSLLSDRKWRVYSAPCAPGIHALGILAAGTLLSLGQGLLLAAFCRIVLGIRWGSALVVTLILLGTSLVAQLAFVGIYLLIPTYGAAATLGWVFAYGSAALGGLIIPLPVDRPFWRFMATYGTPYSLAQTALVRASRGGAQSDVALCVGLLFALCALLMLAVALLGRRRIA